MKVEIKNLALICLSLAVFSLIIPPVFKLIVWLWIPGELEFNEKIFQLDSSIGYTNKANFKGFCYGDVKLETNNYGFRGSQGICFNKVSGVKRIFGVGDSVMFGWAVNERDSILGFLERKLQNAHVKCEVVNAGVVGYSTYQELLFLEEHILPFKPDIILINHCNNDLLSTEEPFDNMRDIYQAYLGELNNVSGDELNKFEKLMLKKIITVFKTSPRIWQALASLEPEEKELCLKVFIEFPLLKMIDTCRRNGIRLIYLFIPQIYGENWTDDIEDDLWINKFLDPKSMVEYCKKILDRENIEYVDFLNLLLPKPGSPKEHPKRVKIVKNNRLMEMLRKIMPQDLFSNFEKVIVMMRYKRLHRSRNYFDACHPTKRGNRIIAQGMYDYLISTAIPDYS